MKKLAMTFILLSGFFAIAPMVRVADAANAKFHVVEEETRVSRDAKRIHLLVESNVVWQKVPKSAKPLLRTVMTRGLKIQSCAAMHRTKRLLKYVKHKGGTLTIRLVDYDGNYITTAKLPWSSCW